MAEVIYYKNLSLAVLGFGYAFKLCVYAESDGFADPIFPLICYFAGRIN